MDVESTDQGVLLPRMTMAQRDAIVQPAHSLMIYQLDANPGFYYNSGTPAAPNWLIVSGTSSAPCESRIPIDSLPFTILSSGSYYVTRSLTGAVNTDGITIGTSNVTIDLNGNTLSGGGGTQGSGIRVSVNITNLCIFNGSIQNWGDEGVDALQAQNSVFKNLRVLTNQQNGIVVGNNNSIIQCNSASNGLDGIDTGRNCILNACNASSNGDDGFETDRGCTVNSSSAFQNGDDGFNTGFGNTVNDNVSTENTGRGFKINNGGTVLNNTAAYNTEEGFEIGAASIVKNNNARANLDHGFVCLQEAYLNNNIADSNTGAGFYTTSTKVRLEDNQSTTNTTYGFQIQGSGDCIIIGNSAISNTITNYFISIGNSNGPIVGPSLGSVTNPFANISL